jgi:hypothetical protein
MKYLYPDYNRRWCLLPCFLLLTVAGDAQLVPHFNTVTSSDSHGYYVYLPAGYTKSANNNKKYPLIVFMHGGGELGKGDTADLPTMLRNAPLSLIAASNWPDSFNVNNRSFQFIVFAPEFINPWPNNNIVDSEVRFAVNHFRVDTARIYMTGLSMGGNITWTYVTSPQAAGTLAAIVPVAGGDFYNGVTGATVVASADLPVLATTNANDPITPSIQTQQAVQQINSVRPACNPQAIDIVFNATGHDAWSWTYNPGTVLYKGLNVYQWMLLYSRDSSSASVNPPPDSTGSPAVQPVSVKFSEFTATVVPGEHVVDLKWTTSIEQGNRYFQVQRSTDGQNFVGIDSVGAAPNAQSGHSYAAADSTPLTGFDFYRIAQVGLNQLVTYSDVREVTLSPNRPAVPVADYLNISPNPTDAELRIDLVSANPEQLEVRLFDMVGQRLRTWKYQKIQQEWIQTIAVGSLVPGSYLVQVVGKDFVMAKTFIKK